jgi:hypothetical protein
MAQYIYTMNSVAKMVPPKQFIIRDISLSFFLEQKLVFLVLMDQENQLFSELWQV